MDGLNSRLDAFWISKLGVARLTELPGGSKGKKPFEKAQNVLHEAGSSSSKLLHELIWEGFDGYFHQTAYARQVKHEHIVSVLEKLKPPAATGPIEWWARQSGRHQVRVLGGVRKELEILTEKGIERVQVTVPFVLEVGGGRLRVRVLTVQSTPPTWTELTGVNVRRLLTPVNPNELANLVFGALLMLDCPLGEMHDLSEQTVMLMKDTVNCHTYSGTFGVRTVGRTRHTAEGGGLGRPRKPLHVVMPSEFRELTSAKQVRHCEIEIMKTFEGLPAGTTVVLHPVEGKIIFRRMLGKGVTGAFLAFVAR